MRVENNEGIFEPKFKLKKSKRYKKNSNNPLLSMITVHNRSKKPLKRTFF